MKRFPILILLVLSGCADSQPTSQINKNGTVKVDPESLKQISKQWQQMSEDEKLANQALTAYMTGNYDEALKKYEQAISINENSAIAYFGRGNVYLKQGNTANALSDYDAAIRLKPDLYNAHLSKAQILHESGESQKAIQQFDKVIETDPNFITAYERRGMVYLQLKQPQKAIEDFKTAINLSPNYFPSRVGLGLAYVAINEKQMAIDNFNLAIEQVERQLSNFGDLDPISLKRILKSNPMFGVPYYHRGQFFLQEGETAKADLDFTRANELGYEHE